MSLRRADHLHRLQTVYDERFAREYGPWRPVVLHALCAISAIFSSVRARRAPAAVCRPLPTPQPPSPTLPETAPAPPASVHAPTTPSSRTASAAPAAGPRTPAPARTVCASRDAPGSRSPARPAGSAGAGSDDSTTSASSTASPPSARARHPECTPPCARTSAAAATSVDSSMTKARSKCIHDSLRDGRVVGNRRRR